MSVFKIVLGLLLTILIFGCGEDEPLGGPDGRKGGSGSGGSSGLGDNNNCAPTKFQVDANPINMLILLDRSNSMRNEKIGEDTYEDIVADAINNVVADNNNINFGLGVFPGTKCDQYDESLPARIECGGTSEISVDVGPGNKDVIEQTLASVGVCGGTPISSSLNWVSTYIEEQMPTTVSNYDTYVLLATDGEPNCNLEKTYVTDWDTTTFEPKCEPCDPNDNPFACDIETLCIDDDATYDAASQLEDNGIKTFVIGIGGADEQRDEILNETAVNGGTSQYYSAEDPDALKDALDEITGKAVSCTFNVDWDAVPNVDDNGAEVDKKCNKVRIAGVEKDSKSDDAEVIPYSYKCKNKDGWQWKGLDKEMKADVPDDTPLTECTTIELCKDACESLKAEEFKEVNSSFGCGVAVY